MNSLDVLTVIEGQGMEHNYDNGFEWVKVSENIHKESYRGFEIDKFYIYTPSCSHYIDGAHKVVERRIDDLADLVVELVDMNPGEARFVMYSVDGEKYSFDVIKWKEDD